MPKKTVRLNELSAETYKFFEKLSGYDTLRLILCKKAILVEGDSDELIVQKAFMIYNDGKLPIEKKCGCNFRWDFFFKIFRNSRKNGDKCCGCYRQ